MKRKSILLIFFLLVSLKINADSYHGLEIAGWYNDGWNTESHNVYKTYNNLFSEVNPYWYNLGTSASAPGNQATDGSIYRRTYAFNSQNITDVHNNNDLILPTIGDGDPGQINTILANSGSRNNLLNNLVNEAVNYNYDGWDLNFEQGDTSSNGRANFVAFCNDLADALHSKNKILSVTIRAYKNSSEESGSFFDYSGLGASRIDRLKMMCYDNFELSINTPQPHQQITWMEQCINYAVSAGIPASKLQLGIANYAWAWKYSGAYTIIFPHTTYSEITAYANPVNYNWNSSAEEWWVDYTGVTEQRRAYFSDKDTVTPRLNLVKQYNLMGVAFWVLGREDSRIYTDSIPTAFQGYTNDGSGSGSSSENNTLIGINLNNVVVYPNPVNTDDEYLVINNLPDSYSINIYTSAGLPIYNVESRDLNNANEIKWYLKDNDGEQIGSGVYYILIKTQSLERWLNFVVLRNN